MEFRIITNEQISATGTTITIGQTGSETWRRSADLASRIANNLDYQKKFLQTVESVNENDVEKSAEAVKNLSRFVKEKYGDEPYFDSGVEHAAFLALVNEIKTNT
jgi:hypothetical protein